MTKSLTINLRLLAATAAFASTEAARYYINGVCLEIGPNGVYYVATDGHRLIASFKSADDAQCADWTETVKIIIPTAECKRAKLTKRSVEDATLTINDDGSCTIAHELTWTFKPVDGSFPDWRRVLPRPTDEKSQAFFNYDYAASFSKFGRDMDIGLAQIIQCDGSGPMPVVFNPDCNSFGVLMPVRGRGLTDWEAPAWVNPPAPKAAAPESEAA